MAGDLTVYGKRENVLVQREENGQQTLYKVNLNSGYDLYASPVYYLQQNAKKVQFISLSELLKSEFGAAVAKTGIIKEYTAKAKNERCV